MSKITSPTIPEKSSITFNRIKDPPARKFLVGRKKTHRIWTFHGCKTTLANWRQGQGIPWPRASRLSVLVSWGAASSARRGGWRAPARRPSPETQAPQDRENGLPRLTCNWSPVQRLTNDERNTRKKKPRGRRKQARPTHQQPARRVEGTEPNRGGREERKMALFERREREKERKREKERETGHRLTGFIVEPNDHACVRFFFFFFFFFFIRGIDEENAHAKYAEERDNRSSKLFTLDEEIVIVVSSPFTIYWTTWIIRSMNGVCLLCILIFRIAYAE